MSRFRGSLPGSFERIEGGIGSMETFFLFVLSVLCLVFYGVFSSWFPSASSLGLGASAFVAAFAFMGVIALVLQSFAKTAEEDRQRAEKERQRQADEALIQGVRDFFARNPNYAHTLRRIRDRTVYRDEFGDWVFTRWFDSLTAFIKDKMHGVFPGPLDDDTADGFMGIVANALEDIWDADATPPNEGVSSALEAHSPRAFEETCAAIFRNSGFSVTLTGASGDQGADILATFETLRVVAQCKQYSSPVGNKAVQEAAAARSFYDAHSAMVISNQGFTSSARQLGEKTDVMLLDVRDLPHVLERVTETAEAT